jgi:hypothetical protein
MKKRIINIKNGTDEEVELTAEEVSTLETEHAEQQAKPSLHEKILQEKELKASAKAKLMSGEALTEDEANTIVL